MLDWARRASNSSRISRASRPWPRRTMASITACHSVTEMRWLSTTSTRPVYAMARVRADWQEPLSPLDMGMCTTWS